MDGPHNAPIVHTSIAFDEKITLQMPLFIYLMKKFGLKSVLHDHFLSAVDSLCV